MTAAQVTDDARQLRLYTTLATYLHGAGVTINHRDLHGCNATWTAATRTLTLRSTAHIADHIAVLTDFIRMITLGEASIRGAHIPRRPPHLTLVT